jgi:TolB-like protein
VLISDRIASEIHNHPELQTVSMGSFQFKNIIRQVEVFAMNGPGLIVPQPKSLAGKTEPVKTRVLTFKKAGPAAQGADVKNEVPDSIAVLPFINMSRDLEEEHFGDCLAEEVLTALTRIEGLKVAARTCSFKYKDSKAGPHKIGEKLGVSSILEGCVRRQNGHLRFTVQLINVRDGFLIWSGRFDMHTEDPFAIQEEIAQRITDKIEAIRWEMRDPAMPKQPAARLAYGQALPYAIMHQAQAMV